tara:strand:+ start:72 stop:356 length:285 start_codon:yes stop_codon:yes gene_type:complete
MLNNLKTVFADGQNSSKLSAKRITSFLLVITLITTVIGNLIFNLTIDQFMFVGLTETVIWSLGFVGAEKFSNVFKRSSTKNYPDHKLGENREMP